MLTKPHENHQQDKADPLNSVQRNYCVSAQWISTQNRHSRVRVSYTHCHLNTSITHLATKTNMHITNNKYKYKPHTHNHIYKSELEYKKSEHICYYIEQKMLVTSLKQPVKYTYEGEQ